MIMALPAEHVCFSAFIMPKLSLRNWHPILELIQWKLFNDIIFNYHILKHFSVRQPERCFLKPKGHAIHWLNTLEIPTHFCSSHLSLPHKSSNNNHCSMVRDSWFRNSKSMYNKYAYISWIFLWYLGLHLGGWNSYRWSMWSESRIGSAASIFVVVSAHIYLVSEQGVWKD